MYEAWIATQPEPPELRPWPKTEEEKADYAEALPSNPERLMLEQARGRFLDVEPIFVDYDSQDEEEDEDDEGA